MRRVTSERRRGEWARVGELANAPLRESTTRARAVTSDCHPRLLLELSSSPGRGTDARAVTAAARREYAADNMTRGGPRVSRGATSSGDDDDAATTAAAVVAR